MSERSFIPIHLGLTMVRREKKSPEQRREQILLAARVLFARQGFEQTTVKEIAHAAQVAEGTIYLYFANKQEVLFAMVKGEMLDPLTALFAEPQELDDATIIKTFIRRNFESSDRNRELIKIMFSEIHHFSGPMLDEFYQKLIQPAMQAMEHYIIRRMAAGAFRRVNPAVAVRSLIGSLRFHSLVWEGMLEGRVEHISREELIDEITLLFLCGLQVKVGLVHKPSDQ